MTLLRIAIILLTLLVVWEVLARSGWLYRDVVPSLLAHRRARCTNCSRSGDYYFNLGVTAGEIGVALLIGGTGRPRRRPCCSAPTASCRGPSSRYLYYLGPTPKIIFFPVMIMWFGVGPESKIALGTLSCFFPVALSASPPACARSTRC